MAPKTLPVASDGAVLTGPLLYYGGVLKSSAGGVSTVDVYDGLSTNGDLIDSFQCAASSRDRNPLSVPIFIMRGIYVDIGANVTGFTLYYDDDEPSDTAGPRVGG